MKYSFVIPCYNSAKTIESVVDEVNETMERLNHQDFNIVLVNDYSPDNTRNVIFGLASKYDNIIAITMAKNFGQHAALLAGYKYADGDYVISLDDDGQTPADEVDVLINKLEEGYDVVFASYDNKHHSSFRNFGSKVNDLMAVKLINKPKDLYLSSYFVARRFVIDEMLKYNGPFPYVSGLVLRTTANICNIPVHHRSREVGSSGYTFSKLFKLWLNGFTAFSIKPLRSAVYLGLMIAVFGFLTVIYALINRFTNPNFMMGWTSLIALVAIVGGVVLIVLGMIGEYIGRIYISINNSPQYVIRDIKGNSDEN